MRPHQQHPQNRMVNMDLAPMLNRLYSHAECLVAENAELCETASRKIGEAGQAVICALIPGAVQKPEEKHPKHEI